MKKDDLTKGPMALHFRRLAIPAALGMLFATLYNVVDVYYAGKLSTDAQAGLAIGYQAFFILMALGFGLSSALSALVSNAKGSGETSQVRRYISQGLTFSVLLTLLSIIVGWLHWSNTYWNSFRTWRLSKCWVRLFWVVDFCIARFFDSLWG